MELSGQMVLFARVVDARSFSAAARDIGLSPSAVSRQIAYLEDRIGVRLVNRTNQGLSLTEEGRSFHSHCVDILSRVTEAERFASSIADHPRGMIRVVSTVAFGRSQLMPMLPDFLARFPDISLSLDLTDRPVDLAGEGIDLAIRFSEQLTDATAIVRKLAPNRRVICAAPLYLERFGAPGEFSDLERHNCLRLSTVGSWNDWALPGMGRDYRLGGNFEATSADGIYHAVLAGIGIARLSTYLVNDDIRAGRLVRLFPEYESDRSDIVAIYADRRNLPKKVRALLDHLAERLGRVPPWERGGAGDAAPPQRLAG